ncbi:MAG: aldo/keto reductase [Candidatus Zipacnadales bacterium]
MALTRRQFLSATATTAAGALTLQRSPGPSQEAPPGSDPFQRRPLGRTGLETSLIGLGTGMRGWMRQSNQTRLGAERFEGLLKYAFERGVRLFDCADLYGTHPYLARALAGLPRQEYLIATKIWPHPGGLPEQERPGADVIVERFRQELNTDYLDLVLLHCQMAPNWPEQQRRYLEGLAELKAKGIIRAHGASIHSLPALEACVESEWVDSVNTRLNAHGDNMDHRDPSLVAPIVQRLHAAGKGVVAMKLIGEGKYRHDPEKRDQSIRYVLGLGCVDTMVVGFEAEAEIDDFAERVRKALEAGTEAP